MTTINIWDIDEPVETFGVDVPPWVAEDITATDLAAIMQGGCASGAYMPAVTYCEALDIMREYGDEVLDYIEGAAGGLPRVNGQSWSQMACTYLSAAVELWAPTAIGEVVTSLETGETYTVAWWQERDRCQVMVFAYDEGPLLFEAWDDELRELIEDGSLEFGDDDSAVEYVAGLVDVATD